MGANSNQGTTYYSHLSYIVYDIKVTIIDGRISRTISNPVSTMLQAFLGRKIRGKRVKWQVIVADADHARINDLYHLMRTYLRSWERIRL